MKRRRRGEKLLVRCRCGKALTINTTTAWLYCRLCRRVWHVSEVAKVAA